MRVPRKRWSGGRKASVPVGGDVVGSESPRVRLTGSPSTGSDSSPAAARAIAAERITDGIAGTPSLIRRELQREWLPLQGGMVRHRRRVHGHAAVVGGGDSRRASPTKLGLRRNGPLPRPRPCSKSSSFRRWATLPIVLPRRGAGCLTSAPLRWRSATPRLPELTVVGLDVLPRCLNWPRLRLRHRPGRSRSGALPPSLLKVRRHVAAICSSREGHGSNPLAPPPGVPADLR